VQPARDPDFDFDEWANLARQDAAAFEQRRREVIEQFIAEAPEHLRERLRRLQWRIDAERSRYKHPLKSCVMIYNMMWDTVYGEHGLLPALNALSDPLSQTTGTETPDSARILPFSHRSEMSRKRETAERPRRD